MYGSGLFVSFVWIGAALVPSLESGKLNPQEPATAPWVHALLGVHAGVSDRVEIGGRLFGFGLPRLGGNALAADRSASETTDEEVQPTRILASPRCLPVSERTSMR